VSSSLFSLDICSVFFQNGEIPATSLVGVRSSYPNIVLAVQHLHRACVIPAGSPRIRSAIVSFGVVPGLPFDL
jgi:hypothetical protein